MNETDFKQKLLTYGLKVRDPIVPTTASIRLYGKKQKSKIIDEKHHEHFYAQIKDIESGLTNERLEHLKSAGKSETDIIAIVQNEYDNYLKQLRKNITSYDRNWQKSFAHTKAKIIQTELGYDNIRHIVDLARDTHIPYELIILWSFNITSEFGEFRTEKPISSFENDKYIIEKIQDFLKTAENQIAA